MISNHLERQLRKMIEKESDKNPGGCKIVIGGHSGHNQAVIDIVKSIPGVEDAKEVQYPNRSGKDIEVIIEPVSPIEISYDGGETFHKA